MTPADTGDQVARVYELSGHDGVWVGLDDGPRSHLSFDVAVEVLESLRQSPLERLDSGELSDYIDLDQEATA